jgi:hypothetical protein
VLFSYSISLAMKSLVSLYAFFLIVSIYSLLVSSLDWPLGGEGSNLDLDFIFSPFVMRQMRMKPSSLDKLLKNLGIEECL